MRENRILCPICGGNHSHMKRVIVYHGTDDPEDRADVRIAINKRGDVKTTHRAMKLPYRLAGIGAVMLYRCESGHGWASEIYTHKGDCVQTIWGSTRIDRGLI